MKLGLVVDQPGLAEAAAQVEQLQANGATELLTIKPRTGEDWYYQVRALLSGDEERGIDPTPEGCEICVVDLHYLGPSALEIMQNVIDLVDGGRKVSVGGQDVADNGLLQAARSYLAAEDNCRRVKVAQLLDKAAKRRNATPPKCILVPVELLPADLAKELSVKSF